jgi:hypothetical protein
VSSLVAPRGSECPVPETLENSDMRRAGHSPVLCRTGVNANVRNAVEDAHVLKHKSWQPCLGLGS